MKWLCNLFLLNRNFLPGTFHLHGDSKQRALMLFIPQENVVPDITSPNWQFPLCDGSGSESKLNEPLTRVQNTEVFASLPVIHQYQRIPFCVETQTQQNNQKNMQINLLIWSQKYQSFTEKCLRCYIYCLFLFSIYKRLLFPHSWYKYSDSL